MKIEIINDKKQWNDFLLSQPSQAGVFLQSWEWGEFQQAVGRKVWRLGIMNYESGIMGVCSLVKMELPMGKSYLYAPRGPIIGRESGIRNYELGDLIEYVKTTARDEKAIFWKIESTQQFHDSCLMPHASCSIQPKQTLILDLSKSEDKLLADMHEKTRYNIRLAERKGVKCQMSNVKCFDDFWKLTQETAKRDKFHIHPKEYYKKMLDALNNPSQPPLNLRGGDQIKPPLKVRGGAGGVMNIRLWIAHYDIATIACAIVGYFGDTATYLHGASSYEHRALMGPYALHWDIIKNAKKQGYKYYDFWGVDEKKWPGITRFKMGFNGKVVDYPGAFDLPLNRFWYTVYRIGKHLRP